MRVLVLTDLFPPVAFGGYEMECAALVDRLRERHDVLVLTSDLDRGRAPADDGVLRELPFAGGGRLRAVVRAPLLALRAARTTRRVLADFRPDLVYVSNGVSLPQAAVVIAARHGAPVIVRLSELFFASELLTGDRFLRHLVPGERGLRGAWARLNRLVNLHPALRVDVRSPLPAALSWASSSLRETAGVPAVIAPSIERVIHPATPRGEVFAQVVRAPADPPEVAYVGRVTVAKGAEVAVRAIAEVRGRHGIDARLVLAGACTPEMAERVDALAAELGVAQHVERLGLLDTEDLAALLGRGAVVVVPTVLDEAFGLVLVEAALARVPVVASRIGGIPEALGDAEALLVEPGDPAALADATAAVLRDPEATAARVQRAHARAGELTLETYLNRSEELIAAVV